MLKRILSNAALFGCVLSGIPFLCAGTFELPERSNQSGDLCNVDLSISIGYITGKSQGLVYYYNDRKFRRTVSRLDWEIGNLRTMNGKVRFNFLNDRLHLIFEGWNKLNADHSYMTDRDYLHPNHVSLQTHISRHPDTRLKTAYAMDIGACYDFYCVSGEASELKLGVSVGCKFMNLYWKSYGGSFNYPFWGSRGKFKSGEKGCSYGQKITVPYIGLQADWRCSDRISVCIFGKYTNLARIQACDHHYMRSIRFVDTFKNAGYWISGVNLKWQIDRRWSAEFNYSGERLNPTVGNTLRKKEGEKERLPKRAGISHSHRSFSAGITTSF